MFYRISAWVLINPSCIFAFDHSSYSFLFLLPPRFPISGINILKSKIKGCFSYKNVAAQITFSEEKGLVSILGMFWFYPLDWNFRRIFSSGFSTKTQLRARILKCSAKAFPVFAGTILYAGWTTKLGQISAFLV